ncbi:lysophospholipid acyltransferase family protein [Sebaldella sp. S0638]|uniref:lysophospholipid acyltransferase family protein n=1 Tax=Sebaldella sp. S0638 TaxID=2957809 RepID=UPI0020A1BFDF|nr:lipid A biosynthesis acyltransferase [Sebaldella sp. S0638]MCP1226188.1 lipid A biosynthesis acyltransferase [Sebaldella sp. S0638]
MLKYKVEYLLVVIVKSGLRILPVKLRFKILEFLGVLTYYAIKKRRNITINNLNIAFPEKNENEIKKLALESYKSTAKNTIIPLYLAELLSKGYIEPENYGLVGELMSQNRGLIITTIHMAGFEAGFFMGKDYDTNVVFKKQKNPYINDMMEKCRAKVGTHSIMKNIENDSNKKIQNVFKNKGVLVLAADQYSNDVDIEFFGKKTKANAGNVILAVKYKVPVLFAYSNYDGYKIKLNFLKEVEIEKMSNLKETVKYNVQNLFYEYEKVIRDNPGEYMWQHNRWKN